MSLISRGLLPIVVAAALLPSVAGAQPDAPPPGPRVWNHVRFAGDDEVRVRTAWESAAPGAEAEVVLRVAGREGELRLHDGGAVVTDVAAADGRVLVAMSELSASATLHLALVEVPAHGAPRLRARRRARMGAGQWMPNAVTVAATPGGFTVLWQAQSFQSRSRQARTLMGTVGADGAWERRPSEVPVPWALADLVWNGDGYHLALYYDGSRPNQTRLCMVTLTEAGQPEQHPWWESRPGMVDEVQLLRVGERIVAAYRGGPRGAELRTRDVHEVGTWGREVDGFGDLGEIGANEEFALRVVDGEVDVVRRAASALGR